jgi:uncharacterized membrane protein
MLRRWASAWAAACSAASLTVAALLFAAMNSCADWSWCCISKDAMIAFCSAALSSDSASAGRSMKNASSLESSSSSPYGGAGSRGGGGGGGGGGAPVPPRGNMT